MSWDVAVSPAGDLIFSPSADLQGISGTGLIEQRMLIRLKVPRGTWTYDDAGSFGSQLYKLLGMAPELAATQADAYVREALSGMDEIEVDTVHVATNAGALTLLIDYHITDEIASMTEENEQQLEFSLTG